MCGIVGYLGPKGAYDILIQGLKRLEYRGYDSAGVAIVDGDGKLHVHKSRGKVANLEQVANAGCTAGSLGIAHTRWATHGEPNDVNAHPHVSQSGMIALVHNGTIENYAVLKKVLKDHGYEFKSETDTEVLVQLIEYIKLTSSCSLPEAVRQALLQVEGAYAIAVVEQNDPDTMIVARKSSPLVIGVGEDEVFIASDATPFVGYTDKVIYLQDNEIGVIRRNQPLQLISLHNNEPSAISIQKLQLSLAQLEKGGYDTFMLKEIFEQPSTLRDCLRGRIVDDCTRVVLSGVELNKERFMNAERITLVACGTSWHAALIGKRLIQDFCQIPVEVEYASEFRYGNPVLNNKDIVISISQSGETADTLAAIQLAREKGAFVYGICNVVGASIPRNTDSGTYIHVGPEIGVASTKAFTGQVTVLTLLALSIGQLRGTVDKETLHNILSALDKMPEIIKEALNVDPEVKKLSRVFSYAHNFLYLGRGYNYPTALEGALKLKEISYIHAEGYPAAEMKHGPIALIDHEMPSVIIAPSDSLYDKIISNVQQVKSRGGAVVAIVSRGNTAMTDIADFCIEIPEVPECLTPIVASIPLQLLAYYIAVNKGKNVDQPRNLAKSVTVE
ncbi:MAG: glutamine--fructose-6-phosphate transaminase (isomerizing) [Duncaniella sp.]|nr:glutamine--fructose-6-phosphate transaminase (isomerizing) [Bacteroides sp.]MDE5827717.1 glutamine--fructose-6-phosphate transaminase (isomerizing) [Duncaniella sp.]MBD5299979.1 glutamine--fructose-6-phosphate transaminase (isomerizing) [Bacteroides sp.]MBD5317836.1 glutamine--fructose-6-phosphate transaminase (isomerizing) [Bacteroides sp.]MBD5353589.1 glutamine--fructose-6-phosphate transaminase (isomerizing) [Bacteroides sp.]